MTNDIFFGRPATIRSQKSLFRNWVESYLPRDDSELNSAYLLKMAKIWEEADLKPGTIRLLMAIVKKYTYARTGREIKSPRLSRSLQNYNKEPVKALTGEQLKTLLETAKSSNPKLYDLLVIAAHTGMRPGEIFSLRGKDINLTTGKISIVNTKTGKPRVNRMTSEVEQVMLKYIKPGREGELLFNGKVPNEQLRNLCLYVKLPPITFHGLRHTHATLALYAGHSPRDVARQLGHAKVSTTLDYYWSALGDDMEIDFI